MVNGRLTNYNVMYVTVRCDKKKEGEKQARNAYLEVLSLSACVRSCVRTDRGETKTSFYPGFYQTSVDKKGVDFIRD